MSDIEKTSRQMLPAQRQALILELVRKTGGASITMLTERLGASTSTIRRDLDYLTEQGYLQRTHGGATVRESMCSTFEPASEIGSHVAHDAKVAIGREAAGLIENGQSVIFDSSSTVFEAAKAMSQRELHITAVTNDLKIGLTLSANRDIRLVMLGGTLRPGLFTLTGEPGQSFLGGLHTDLAFVGIHSLAGQRLSETAIEVAEMKKRMIAASRRTIVLADSSKFRDPAFCEVCGLFDVDHIVTDSGIEDKDRRAIEALDVTLTVVDLPPTAT
ncbi:MAG: DeoR/GlpR transcriptional regulator [Proteobacteria bacterium]|nr:MAG: DeoR/GlpR transcriptional regulator [Pseudomonadota bacterium]